MKHQTIRNAKYTILPAALIALALPAQAAVVTTITSSGAPPTVSATDLVHGLAPVVVGTSSLWTGNQNWAQEGNTGVSAVNDGVFAGRATVGMGGSNRAVTGNAGGIDLIWNFSTPQDFSSISLYFSWSDGGRDNVPVMNIYTSPFAYVLTSGPNPDGQFSTGAVDAGFAANGGFTLLGATVNTAPTSGNISTVTFSSDNANPIASSVSSLYIQFGAAENGFVGLNEIDVFAAAPVPEPSTMALSLVGLGALALLRRRNAA